MTIASNQRTLVTSLVIVLSLGLGLVVAQTDYGEAPQLAQQVEAGELPPVEERLPVDPMVVPVVERIGDYGGTWRTALTGPGDTPWLTRTIGYEHLVRVNSDWTEIIPNIVASYEVSDDAAEFTFTLREGMRWSDGHPLTADDFLFWYEDVFSNNELTPAPTSWLVTDGEPVVVEKLDDYTVVFRFSAPNGLFLTRLAAAGGSVANPLPRHYLERYHIGHNPDGIDALVRESGLADWAALFANRSSIWDNADRPSLLAWVVTSELGEGTRFVVERNPYYWKIDEEGNQLPYLDSVVFDIIADTEVMLLRAMSGDIDMHERHFNTATNKAILIDNMERGNYRLFDTVWSSDNRMVILLNLTHSDPVKREIFQNRDFRAGLSHAIDRQEIIDLVFVGEGEPVQAAPRPEAPFYNEELALQFTEYNVGLANEYLDRAFPERDAQGFRLGPDGNRITFTVELFPNDVWVDSMELVQDYWREVGVDAQVRVIDRSLYQTRFDANEHDAGVWFGGPGLMDAMLDMRWYMPGPAGAQAMYAVSWVKWFQGASGAEEPPAEVRRQMDLYRTLLATADEEEQIELMRQILEISQEQFYAIGITSRPNEYGIVKNNFRNVPEWMFASPAAYNQPAPTNPEQYFIEQGQ